MHAYDFEQDKIIALEASREDVDSILSKDREIKNMLELKGGIDFKTSKRDISGNARRIPRSKWLKWKKKINKK